MSHRPVTPTLFIGEPPPGDDVREVTTVDEAVAVIEAGLVAVLPEGAWEEAEQVLTRVANEKIARLRVRIARTEYRG